MVVGYMFYVFYVILLIGGLIFGNIGFLIDMKLIGRCVFDIVVFVGGDIVLM